MPGTRPVGTMLILVEPAVASVVEPVAGVATSQVPPTGVVAVVAVQVSAFVHAPVAGMDMVCAAGAD